MIQDNNITENELSEIIEQLQERDEESLLRREEMINQLHQTDDIYLVE